uniref:Transmembrane protein 267 n=1 Tax=Anopheles dirus TaxID=7168 RepID=A0A182N7T4_9DIPT
MNLNVALLIKHVILCLVCVVGDKLCETVQKPAILRACIDNATHAFIGCLAAEIILNSLKHYITRQEYCVLLLTATIVSSCIDLDHFIEAKSFSLQDATHLSRRPFLHNSAICVGIFIAFLVARRTVASTLLRLFIAMGVIAFSTHHMRDATRRGIWLKTPFQNYNSPAVPYVGYVAFVNMIPHAMIYLLQAAAVAVPKMKLVELV